MNRRKKIAVIGSGFTGATTALYLAQQELGDVVLVDRPEQENPTKGKALDMQEAAPILGFDVSVKGTSDYADINGADIVDDDFLSTPLTCTLSSAHHIHLYFTLYFTFKHRPRLTSHPTRLSVHCRLNLAMRPFAAIETSRYVLFRKKLESALYSFAPLTAGQDETANPLRL